MKQYQLEKEGYAIFYHELPGAEPRLVFLHGVGCASSFEYPAVMAQPPLLGRGAFHGAGKPICARGNDCGNS